MSDTLKAIIFDLDGTLADTYPLIFMAFNHFAKRYLGREYEPGEIEALFGPAETKIISSLVPPEKRDEAIEYYYGSYMSLHHHARLFDGIGPMLEEVYERNIPLGIFTGKGKRSARITLRELGIERMFKAVVSGDDVSCRKPDPEGLLLAAKLLGIEPQKALMVGDHPVDILAGKAAGVQTAAALWHNYKLNELISSGPDLTFKTPFELKEWLKKN